MFGRAWNYRHTPRVCSSLVVAHFLAPILASLASGYARPDDEILSSIKQRLQALGASRGRPLDDEEYFKALAEFGPLAGEDWKAAFDYWAGTQKPVIARADLARIISEKVASLWAFDAQYTVTRREVGSDTPAKTEIERSVIVRDKYYLKREKLDPATGQPQEEVVTTFDSGIWRDFTNRGHLNGSIQKQDHANFFSFFGTESLFANSMLAGARLPNRRFFMGDLEALLSLPSTTVLSRTWVVGGEKCIKVVGGVDVYLSLDKEFAAVKASQRGPRRTPSGKLEAPLVTYTVRNCGKFENCGGGFWIPHEVKLEFYKKGKFEKTTEIAVRYVTVNHPVADSLFRDLWPGGTAVQDAINHTLYVTGRDGSTKGAIKILAGEARNARRGQRRWLWAFVGANVLVVVCLAWLVYRKRRKKA